MPQPFSPSNPHPLSQLKTELVWEGKYDEYGRRREVDIAGCAMPLQRIETIDPPFDVGADFTMDVPIGDGKETVFKDQSCLEMVAFADTWGKGTDTYLHMMFERLGDPDVREYVRAIFVPLIRERTTTKEERRPEGPGRPVTDWKPFQVTHSQEHPAIPAARTAFNLVTCNRGFEVGMSRFLDRAPDVAAFAKNAGPQALRVDYSTRQGQIAFYTPDFLARLTDGSHLLVETKGRVDRDVPLKARAAAAWCKAAGKSKKWRYLYVPQETFETFTSSDAEMLARACEPALQDLLGEAEEPQLTLPFGEARPGSERLDEFIADADFAVLPPAHRKMVRQAVVLFRFLENKPGQSLAPVFTPLLGPLDEASKAVLLQRLGPEIPAERDAIRAFFEPDTSTLSKKDAEMCRRRGSDLKRTLVDHNGMSPIGLLRWCFQFARESTTTPSPALAAVRRCFAGADEETYLLVNRINTFRNDYIAHQNKELAEAGLACDALKEWSAGLIRLWRNHQAGSKG